MVLTLYVTHPEVVIDPDLPTPRWGLSATGRARVPPLYAALTANAPGEGHLRPYNGLCGGGGRERRLRPAETLGRTPNCEVSPWVIEGC